MGCYGLSALHAIFWDKDEDPNDPGYDLIATAKTEIMNAKVSWKYKHVAGHQDDHLDERNLDRWARLKVEADAMEKGFMAMAKTLPRHFLISNEPWSL